jgi:uncharacterized membrane protein
MPGIIKLFLLYIGMSIVAALGWLILSYPSIPSTPSEWGILFLVALPLTIVFELIGERVNKNPINNAIETKTRHKKFSWLRILYGVFEILIVLFIIWAGFVLFETYV